MDRQIQSFLNKTSVICATIATIVLASLLLHTPETCIPDKSTHSSLKFPRSTCDLSHRSLTTLDKKNRRLWSTSAWLNKVRSFSILFREAQRLSLLANSSKALCLLAGAGQEVMALNQIGVDDVTGIDLVDSPPLVSRADPNNLPFFDDVFDIAFSAQFDVVLFPSRFIAEMERTVGVGGFCVLVVQERTEGEVMDIVRLFRRGKFVDSKNITLSGWKMTRIVLRIINSTSI
ncbi:hypothetical protein Nepgr_000488 [Nepenthes gracilis]|uniref:Methyltransferase type 11 domain-containing protein n=1 Tax=Nepenthes gracilis TaxID=150966 RepID=A0AAD3P324_NEPGR|nr:hypothetical protein Nepgr_000488 [Nepenthes gracilis]